MFSTEKNYGFLLEERRCAASVSEWYATNPGLWFWCGCALCASFAPKMPNLRHFFRQVNPAPGKSNPKTFAHYMRGAVKRPNLLLLSPNPLCRCWATCSVRLGGWRVEKALAEDYWGLPARSIRALLPAVIACQYPAHWPLATQSLDCLPGSLDCDWRS